MKFKILILLFPIFLFSQEKNLLDKIEVINQYVKQIDSISNVIKSEEHSGVWIVSHSKRTQLQNPLYTFTQLTKYQNQIIRICYRLKQKKKIEDWHIYYQNSKLVYVEIIKWRGKKNSKKKYYFENEISVYPKYSSKFTVDDEMEIFFKVKEIIK